MDSKKVAIVGAGPGGLTAAMLLAHRNFEVHVYEKEERVGGRNSSLTLGDYKFDLGPTFLMMKFILDEMFLETGRKSSDYLEFTELDPMYRLQFEDFDFHATKDKKEMKQEIKRLFPGHEEGLDRFMKREKKRLDNLFPCLQKDYSSFSAFFRKAFIKAGFDFAVTKSLFQVLNNYFQDEKLTLSFTFQSKYLGMSPWDCPGAFAIIPFIEHKFGIYHVKGGLSKISEAMADVVEEEGGKIHLDTTVKEIKVENGKAMGLVLEDGQEADADEIIMNADFAYSMANLFPENTLKKYTDKKLRKKKYSCSTFMLYLGLDKVYDTPHHNIILAKEYKKNVDEIFSTKTLSKEPSMYIRNASITDDSLAPEGHSAVYVLVPIPNNKSDINWDYEKDKYKDLVLELISKRTEMTDIKKHIVEEKIITPWDWENEYNIFLGATFNLAHNLGQMLYFRPRNKFEEVRNCYLVGGGTHPGSGLPTIYESGRISVNLICDKYDMDYDIVSLYF